MKTIHAIISGRVQGVCYRAWTADQAAKLGLNGWVRNRSDGTVEALFSGIEGDVDAILAACRRGPSLAHVVDVVVNPVDAPQHPGFLKRSSV